MKVSVITIVTKNERIYLRSTFTKGFIFNSLSSISNPQSRSFTFLKVPFAE